MITHSENFAGLSLVFLPACLAENVPSTEGFGTPRRSTGTTPEDVPRHRWRRFAHIAVFATRTLDKIALDLPSNKPPFSLSYALRGKYSAWRFRAPRPCQIYTCLLVKAPKAV